MTLLLRQQNAQDRIEGREPFGWNENDYAVVDETRIGRIYREQLPDGWKWRWFLQIAGAPDCRTGPRRCSFTWPVSSPGWSRCRWTTATSRRKSITSCGTAAAASSLATPIAWTTWPPVTEARHVELAVVGGDGTRHEARPLTDGHRPPGADLAAAEFRPDDVAIIFYTSGTTGRPKGVTLTRASLTAGTTQVPRPRAPGTVRRRLGIGSGHPAVRASDPGPAHAACRRRRRPAREI